MALELSHDRCIRALLISYKSCTYLSVSYFDPMLVTPVSPKVPVQLTRDFLTAGTTILGLDPRSRVTTLIELFRSNFKYSPSRCAFLFLRIVDNPVLPDAYEPKHLLWTLNFLLTYATERRMCCFLRADRKTIRKYVWPTISALASLSRQYVSLLWNQLFVNGVSNKISHCLIVIKDSLGKQTY